MKTKVIKSKKVKVIYIFDILVLLICLLRSSSTFNNLFELVDAFKIYKHSKLMILLLIFYSLWMFCISIVFKNLLIIAIYLAIRIPKMRMLKKNSKYEVIDNIDYYRERFNNLSPTEISLITDLQIETKKDLSASILDLYNKKVIDFENNNLIIKNVDNDNLKDSEKLLIKMLTNKDFNSISVNNWKNVCEQEAIDDNYITPKKKTPFGFLRELSVVAKWFLVLIISCVIGAAYVATPHFKELSNNIKEYDKLTKNMEYEEVLKLIKNDEKANKMMYKMYVSSIPLVIVGTFIIASLFALIAMPTYLKARFITYRLIDANDKYERTNESKLLVEQIAGMKNFIHDFSTLDDDAKESVKLWNDFLIYAVLLEENSDIVKDIFKYKNVNSNVIDYVDKSINNI